MDGGMWAYSCRGVKRIALMRGWCSTNGEVARFVIAHKWGRSRKRRTPEKSHGHRRFRLSYIKQRPQP